MNVSTFSIIFTCIYYLKCVNGKYEAKWDSLGKRPLPKWLNSVKVGVYIHFGLYSIPSLGYETGAELIWDNIKKDKHEEHFKKYYSSKFEYGDLAPLFKIRHFNPKEWIEIIQNAGVKYLLITAKHSDGYGLWPSNQTWNFNSYDTGPQRDILGELAKEICKTDLYYGFHYNIKDAFRKFTDKHYKENILPELKELVERYKPDIIRQYQFVDDFPAEEFIAWLYNESPVKDHVVINYDESGDEKTLKAIRESVFLMTSNSEGNDKQNGREFVNVFQIDKQSSGYRRNTRIADYENIENMIKILVQSISYGGGVIYSIGINADGVIPLLTQERLKVLGEFLKINGEAVYDTKPWKIINDPKNGHVWYTSKKGHVYGFLLKWPKNGLLTVSVHPAKGSKVTMLGVDKPLEFNGDEVSKIILPKLSPEGLPSKIAWVLKFDKVI